MIIFNRPAPRVTLGIIGMFYVKRDDDTPAALSALATHCEMRPATGGGACRVEELQFNKPGGRTPWYVRGSRDDDGGDARASGLGAADLLPRGTVFHVENEFVYLARMAKPTTFPVTVVEKIDRRRQGAAWDSGVYGHAGNFSYAEHLPDVGESKAYAAMLAAHRDPMTRLLEAVEGHLAPKLAPANMARPAPPAQSKGLASHKLCGLCGSMVPPGTEGYAWLTFDMGSRGLPPWTVAHEQCASGWAREAATPSAVKARRAARERLEHVSVYTGQQHGRCHCGCFAPVKAGAHGMLKIERGAETLWRRVATTECANRVLARDAQAAR